MKFVSTKFNRRTLLLHLAFSLFSGTGAPAVSECGVGQWFDSEGTGACEPCGSCKDADDCDVQTGVCPNGCADWYFPANTCNRYVVDFAPYLTLSHIIDGPEVKYWRPDRIEVCFYQNETLVQRDDRRYYAYVIQYFKVGSNTYTQDVDLIRVQDEPLIHKDVLGLEYDTEYRFRIALLRTFDNDRLTETIGVSTVAVGRTQCREADVPMVEKALIQSTLTDVEFHFLFGDNGCREDKDFDIELRYTFTNASNYEARVSHEIPKGLTRFTVNNLQEGLTYYFYVVVRNAYTNEIVSPAYALTLTWVAYNEQMTTETPVASARDGGDDDDDDDDDDVIMYVSLAVAVLALLIALLACVLSLVLVRRFRASKTALYDRHGCDRHGYLVPVPSTHASEAPCQTPTDRPPLPVPDSDKHLSKSGYEDLTGSREPSAVYDQLDHKIQ